MALPADLATGTITGTYLNWDGTPCAGTVTLTPAPGYLNDPGDAIILTSATTVTLDETGSFSVVLPAGNDPDLSPLGWTYTASVSVAGSKKAIATTTFVLEPDATVDLTTVTPSDSTKGTANVIIGGGTVDSWADVTATPDFPAVIAAGADQAAARAAINAGTSNLVTGTTAGTAKPGDWKPDFTVDVTGKPLTYPPAAHNTDPATISGSTTFGQALLSVASAGALRTAAGAGTTGGSVFAAETGADARTAMGAVGTADVAAAVGRNAANGVAGLDSDSLLTYATAAPGSRFDLPCPGGVQPLRPSARTDIFFDWLMVAAPTQGSGYAIDGDGWRKEAT